MTELKEGEKWFLFVFLNDDDTRKLILKAKSEQENTRFGCAVGLIRSPAFQLSCNAEAVFLHRFNEASVLLFSTKDDNASQSDVVVLQTRDRVDSHQESAGSRLGKRTDRVQGLLLFLRDSA